ncbi:hypothetical protein ACF09H_41045 [Streptomyces sp. NPDC014983]|uniref:hypothetical protein n=1 Tax=Streptomyces sp. NPDC014983 TaxID=3364933 RepID=UPI00370365D2
MRLWDGGTRPAASARPAWAALLVAVLVGAVLAAALGGCPRMRTLAGSAPGFPHRPLVASAPGVSHRQPVASAPRAAAPDAHRTAGSRCHGAKPVAAVAPDPSPRAQACVSDGAHRTVPASAPPPSPQPPAPRRVPGGRPEVLLRV